MNLVNHRVRRWQAATLIFIRILLFTLAALALLSGCRPGPRILSHEGERLVDRLPETENVLVLRTDFSDEKAWKRVCAAVQAPQIIWRFRANVDCLDDPAFRGVTVAQLLRLVPDDYQHGFIFLVDETTISSPESPLLVVDLVDEPGRSFRTIPSEAWGIENNLSLANMDWEEFADYVDEDGVFRGYEE